MELMALIVAEADNLDIEKRIKKDAALGLMLLRLVNATDGAMPPTSSRKIDSLSQALDSLGRLKLHRWLQVLLYAEPGKVTHSGSPLLMMATVRGKLLELMTQKLFPENLALADTAFTVGIMSLMDTLLGTPMEDLLGQMEVDVEVRAALLERGGVFGDMLTLVEHVEQIEDSGDAVKEALRVLNLTSEALVEIQLAAFEWSDAISRSAT
jgi:EAL and modified HD-GYP domain-containing signal transduction protein